MAADYRVQEDQFPTRTGFTFADISDIFRRSLKAKCFDFGTFGLAFSADTAYHFGKDKVRISFV
jgi:hypothetical protein